jgi:hypothetical protein
MDRQPAADPFIQAAARSKAAGLVILATHIFAEKGPYNAWLLELSVAAISHCHSPSSSRSDAMKRAATITRQGYYGE